MDLDSSRIDIVCSDPQNTRTDAEIISALRRSWLLPNDGTPADPATDAKFSLDATVSDEGAYYSVYRKLLYKWPLV